MHEKIIHTIILHNNCSNYFSWCGNRNSQNQESEYSTLVPCQLENVLVSTAPSLFSNQVLIESQIKI